MLEIKKGVTSIIGGGGKTTMMLVLAKELSPAKVILATSTRIYPMPGMRNLVGACEADVVYALEKSGMVCVGEPAPDGKLGPARLSFETLERISDYVLVEADGSKGLPVKAHRPNEPVLPESSNQTILVVGMSALGRRIKDAAHCPGIYAGLAGCVESDVITCETIARVIRTEGLKSRVFLNQIHADGESADACDLANAARIAGMLDCPVCAGSLLKGVYRCLR